MTEARSQARSIGRSSDLSTEGCYVDTLSTFGIGAAVHVRLKRDMRVFEADAVVINAQMSMGMGLAFTNIQPNDQAVLRTWIAEMNGERPSGTELVVPDPTAGLLEAFVDLRQVLNELINLMVRRKVITEHERTALLRRMNKT